MIDDDLKGFLGEDVFHESWDLSNKIVRGEVCTAEVRSNDEGVVAGVDIALDMMGYVGVEWRNHIGDGERIKPGETILEIRGDAVDVLRIERPLLNLLSRMSGVATKTRECVDASEDDFIVAGTRKTTPGFRYYEKEAIRIGGGDPHRLNLSDSIMVKDNHIGILGFERAVEEALDLAGFTDLVEVEVESVDDGVKAAEMGVDIVMLDNMDVEDIEKAVSRLEGFDVAIEVSGGMDMDNLSSLVGLGIDVVSIGGLVYDSGWLDISMDVVD